MRIRSRTVAMLVIAQVATASPASPAVVEGPSRASAGPIKDGNVKDFAGRFDKTLSEVLRKLLPKLDRLRPPSGAREDLISLDLEAAGGSVRVEGLGLLLPEPRRFDLSIELSGVTEPDPKKGSPLRMDGILQFDFVTHGRNLADGLFRGVLRLGGRYRGAPEINGEMRNGRIVGLIATTPNGNSRSGKRPNPFVTYTGTLAGNGYYSDGNQDGNGKDAKFSAPTGVEVDDETGAVYVADQDNGSIRRISPNRQVSTVISGLEEPNDLAFDGYGDLIVSQKGSGSAPLGRLSLETETLTPIVFNRTETGDDLCGRILGSCDGRSPLGTMQSVNGIDVHGGVIYATQAHYPGSIKLVLPDGTVSTIHRVDEGGREGGDCGHAGILGGTRDVAQGRDGELYFVITATGCYGVLVLEPDGTVTTLAGDLEREGNEDGIGEEARFFDPSGLAFDGNHYLYVADTQNSLIRRIDVDTGEVVRLAGCLAHRPGFDCNSQDGFRDGNRDRAQFYLPTGIALDGWGDLYVADKRNNAIRIIRVIDVPERDPLITGFAPFAVTRGRSATVEVTGSNLGLAEGADLGPGVAVLDLRHAGDRRLVLDVEVDPEAEPGPRTLTIQTPYGTVTGAGGLSFEVLADDVTGAEVTTIAGTGSWVPGIHDGPAEASQFGFPTGMDMHDADRLLVVDTLEQRIRLVATKDGASQELLELMLYASGATGAINGIVAGLGPAGLILSQLGIIDFIVGASEDTLRPIVAQVIQELCAQATADCSRLAMPWAAQPLVTGGENGIRLNASYYFPTDVASAGGGKFFVADAGNTRIRTVGVDPSGEKPEDAPYTSFSTDRLDDRPMSVVEGPGSSALAALPGSHLIQKIEMKEDGVVTDFAGVAGRIGCVATDAGHLLGVPLGMDRKGDATYVADPYCQTIWRIEDGTVSDIRGNVRLPGPALGPCSDGPAAFAGFGAPMDVAVDAAGNIWFVDTLCGSIRVVRNLLNQQSLFEKAEILSGFLTSVKDHIPASLGTDFAGLIENLDENFLAANSWWVTTVAGSMDGDQGYVDGPAEDARFFIPIGIAVSGGEERTKVYISDAGNLRIRLLDVPDGTL